jgi:acylphosphatase
MRRGMSARVTGRVQGVSFRWYTLRRARELALDGWVRNEADGSVRVHASGEPAALDELSEFLASGSPLASVDEVRIEAAPVLPVGQGFEIEN